jgi:hypothetical protein
MRAAVSRGSPRARFGHKRAIAVSLSLALSPSSGCDDTLSEPPAYLAVVEGRVTNLAGQPVSQTEIVVEVPPGVRAGASMSGSTGFYRVNVSAPNTGPLTSTWRVRAVPPAPYQPASLDTVFSWHLTPGPPTDTLVVNLRLSQ